MEDIIFLVYIIIGILICCVFFNPKRFTKVKVFDESTYFIVSTIIVILWPIYVLWLIIKQIL